MKWISLILFALVFSSLSAEKLVYKTFYLGFHADDKARVIKNDFLSEDGKMYSLGRGSYFVRDHESILKDIEVFLENQAGTQAKSLIIQLKDNKVSKNDDFNIKGQIKTNPFQGRIELGEQSINSNQNSTLTITALNGHAAKMTDLRKTQELRVYRNRYMSLYIKENFQDGFEFEVLPVLQGNFVKVILKRNYYATINGKRRSFKESTLQTTRIVKLGQWSELAGASQSSTNNKRSITGLEYGKESTSSNLDMSIRVDVLGNTTARNKDNSEFLIVPEKHKKDLLKK